MIYTRGLGVPADEEVLLHFYREVEPGLANPERVAKIMRSFQVGVGVKVICVRYCIFSMDNH